MTVQGSTQITQSMVRAMSLVLAAGILGPFSTNIGRSRTGPAQKLS